MDRETAGIVIPAVAIAIFILALIYTPNFAGLLPAIAVGLILWFKDTR